MFSYYRMFKESQKAPFKRVFFQSLQITTFKYKDETTSIKSCDKYSQKMAKMQKLNSEKKLKFPYPFKFFK